MTCAAEYGTRDHGSLADQPRGAVVTESRPRGGRSDTTDGERNGPIAASAIGPEVKQVERTGIEPVTPCLQSDRHSPARVRHHWKSASYAWFTLVVSECQPLLLQKPGQSGRQDGTKPLTASVLTGRRASGERLAGEGVRAASKLFSSDTLHFARRFVSHDMSNESSI
jgi:hypothetical protein